MFSHALVLKKSFGLLSAIFMTSAVFLFVASQWLTWSISLRFAFFLSLVILSGIYLSLRIKQGLLDLHTSLAAIIHFLSMGIFMVIHGQSFISGAGSEELFCIWALLQMPWIFILKSPLCAFMTYICGGAGVFLLTYNYFDFFYLQVSSSALPSIVYSFIFMLIAQIFFQEQKLGQALAILCRFLAISMAATAISIDSFIFEKFAAPIFWIMVIFAFLAMPVLFKKYHIKVQASANICAVIGSLIILNFAFLFSLQYFISVFLLLFINILALGLINKIVPLNTHGALILFAKLGASFFILLNLLYFIFLYTNGNFLISGITLLILSFAFGLWLLYKHQDSLLLSMIGAIFGTLGASIIFFYNQDVDIKSNLFCISLSLFLLTCVYRLKLLFFIALVLLHLFCFEIKFYLDIQFIFLLLVAFLLKLPKFKFNKILSFVFFPLVWSSFLINCFDSEFFTKVNFESFLIVKILLISSLAFFIYHDNPYYKRFLVAILFAFQVYIWPESACISIILLSQGSFSEKGRKNLQISAIVMAVSLYFATIYVLDDADVLITMSKKSGLTSLILITIYCLLSSQKWDRTKFNYTFAGGAVSKSFCGALALLIITISLFSFNFYKDNKILNSGVLVYAKLEVVDPIDILMGYYMVLAYDFDNENTMRNDGKYHTLYLKKLDQKGYLLSAEKQDLRVLFPQDSFNHEKAKLPRRFYFSQDKSKYYQDKNFAVLKCNQEIISNNLKIGGQEKKAKCLVVDLK